MALPKKALYMFLGGLLALALVFGGAMAFAQSGDDDPETDQTTPEEEGTTEDVLPFGGQWHMEINRLNDKSEALAEALGITVDELAAARQQVREQLIAQAVADGLLTQEQADELLAQDGLFMRGFGRGGHFGFGTDSDELLAEALGITLDELQAAQAEVHAARLAAMVEAGYLTQEQADTMLARQAVQNYIDREAIQDAVQSYYEAAVAEALAAGDITQEQADALLADIESAGGFFGPGGMMGQGMGLFMGPEMGAHGGRGHHGGMSGGMMPGGMMPGGMSGFFQNSQPAVTESAAGA